MAGLRFPDLQSRPTEFLDFTSLTLDEFPQLVPPFEAAFHARMAAWRLDGKPRTARRFSVYQNCPLRSCMATLRIIPITAKPGTMPYLNPLWEGQRHGVTPFFLSAGRLHIPLARRPRAPHPAHASGDGSSHAHGGAQAPHIHAATCARA